MRELREIIADSLPTSTLPRSELLAAADRIIAEVQRAGYQFYEYNPPRPSSMEQGGISDRLSNFDEWGDRIRDRD